MRWWSLWELIPRAVSPDYEPELEGAMPGGRSMDPAPFDGRRLGTLFHALRAPYPSFMVFGGMMVNRKDIDALLGAKRSLSALRHSLGLVGRFARDRMRWGRGTRLVMQMNEAARTGVDEAFGRGASAYDRYLGDPLHAPNPCLGPIRTAPFYAIQVWPGDIGTAAGLETDAKARALDASGAPIPGLYVCGNDMASIMGGTYPSAGITLGPNLTFGYIAGQALAAQARMPEAA